MGLSEVQGLVQAQDAGHPLAGAHCAPPDKVVRPLEPALWPRPNNGSRMTRECHVRFCESAGVRSPRATHRFLPEGSAVGQAGEGRGRYPARDRKAPSGDLYAKLLALDYARNQVSAARHFLQNKTLTRFGALSPRNSASRERCNF